jgi:hypothetical protein
LHSNGRFAAGKSDSSMAASSKLKVQKKLQIPRAV